LFKLFRIQLLEADNKKSTGRRTSDAGAGSVGGESTTEVLQQVN